MAAGEVDVVRRRRLARWVLAAIGGVALAVVMLTREGPPPPERGGEAPDLAATLDRVLDRRARPVDPGLAIRPFDTPEGDADTAALADMACEALAARLARLDGLRLASCGSTRLAYAAGLDDAALARLLDARWLVKGRLRPAGAGRVGLQVVLQAAGEAEDWRIDETLAIAELQALPERVAGVLAAQLGQAAPAPSPSPLAPVDYERFVRAAALARRHVMDDLRESYRLVEQVLAAAPEHVPALVLRQSLRPRIDGFLGGGPGEQGDPAHIAVAQAAIMRDAGTLGERLIGLDPDDPRARLMLAYSALYERRWDAVFAQADALLARSARHPGVLRSMAKLHLMAGYVERASALALEAMRLDALDAAAIEYRATTLGMLGRDAQMRELLTLAAQVGHSGIDLFDAILAHRGRDWPAFEQAMRAYALNTDRDAAWVAAYARGAADPAEREAAARLLDGHDPGLRFYMSDYFVEYALLGDPARSMAAIRRHAQQPPKLWLEYLWWPELAAVRRDPAFVEAMDEVGLTALWERRGAPDRCARGADGRWTCR